MDRSTNTRAREPVKMRMNNKPKPKKRVMDFDPKVE